MTGTRRHLVFVLLGAVSLLVGWRPLVATFSLALNQQEYTHILLVLPVSAMLLVRECRDQRLPAKPGFGAGGSLMALALLIGLFSNVRLVDLAADVQRCLEMVALVTWWVGAFVLCFGVKAARALIFPLCFLYWLVPFPDVMLSRMVAWLQQGSSSAAYLMFVAAGVPVNGDGVILSIPGLTLEVAKECSSIRSSLMLIVTTMVLAQVALHSLWRKALLVAVAIPLSIAKNGFRIFTLGMLATRVDPGFLTGNLHHHGGFVFFSIALAVVFLLLWILRRSEGRVANPVSAGVVGLA
jgi:exosortase